MRLQEIIVNESTVAGSIAIVAMPLGSTQRRANIGKGIYEEPWANSLAKKKPKKTQKSQIKETQENTEDVLAKDEMQDKSEYDQEGEMAKSQSRNIADAAHELQQMLDDDENLPEWVQKKITLAQNYIDTARDYLKANRPQI